MSTATIVAAPQHRKAICQRAPSVDHGSEALDLAHSIRQIWSADKTPTDRARNLFRLLASRHDVVAATLFDRGSSTEYRPTVPLMCLPEYSRTARAWETALLQGVLASKSSSGVTLLRLPGGSESFVGVLAPVVRGEAEPSIVCLVGRRGPTAETCLSLTAQLVAAELATAACARRDSATSSDGPASEALLHIVMKLLVAGDVGRGYDELATHLRGELGCHSILLGVRSGWRGRCVLRAISGIPRFGRHSPLASCADAVLHEAVLRNAIGHSDSGHPASTATDTQKELAQLCQVRGIVSGPIRDANDKPIGAWAILHDDAPGTGQKDPRFARVHEAAKDLPSRLGPCVELLQRYRPRLPQRMVDRLFGPSFRRARLLVPVAIGLACLMALPLPYRVKCDCVVQPVTRRFVPAPYSGVLQEVLVGPGDVVRAEQVLARMDGREIAWELVARQSEYKRWKKQYEVHLADDDAAAAQIARLEMDRLSQQITILENKATKLEIRNPIDGVVIGGDPEKKEAHSLTMGEGLFEIAPLDEMVVELLVPDEEVSYVQQSQEVAIRLDAFPGSPFVGTIRRVSPQAELRGQENVFVAEVYLANSDGTLRPGMMGRCRVGTVERPLCWNLFHRVWDRLVYQLAW